MSDVVDDPNRDADEEYIFNEYAMDDTLDLLRRLTTYYQSDFGLQRLVLVRDLCDTVRYAGFDETVRQVMPLLPSFAADSEPAVRQALVQQLHPLATFLIEAGSDAGYQLVLSALLPVAFDLLVDRNVEVGAVALQAIRQLAACVRSADVQAHLLNVVTTLAHDERAEDYRVVAAELFSDLAPYFGADVCSTTVLPELELLSNDSSFSVRKAVAASLGAICGVVKEPLAQQTVINFYLGLCHDDIWGVRQACAASAEEVAEGLPPAARVEHIVPAFQHLLEDNSRWVRNRAHESLGRLLHALEPADVTPKLLQLYTDMAFQSENNENELSEYCAFSFPAVVQVVGPGRWEELQDAYATMLKDVQWKVRKTLAYSLHEVAALLGTELVEKHLVVAFELLLRDLDDIKLGVVVRCDQFLKLVTPPTLDRLVPLLCHVPLESENWRLRNEVAKRIGDVAVLLSPTDASSFAAVIALVLRLLDDSVMEVRASTYQPAAAILQYLYEAGQTGLSNYAQTILELAERPSFQGRQMFAYVAQQAAELGADGLVEDLLLDGLLQLASDPVSNVRLVLGKVMEETFLPRPPGSKPPVKPTPVSPAPSAATTTATAAPPPKGGKSNRAKWKENPKIKEIMRLLAAQKNEDDAKTQALAEQEEKESAEALAAASGTAPPAAAAATSTTPEGGGAEGANPNNTNSNNAEAQASKEGVPTAV